MLIVALKNQYKEPALLAHLALSRSSYVYHRTGMNLEDKYLPARSIMADIFENNHRCYGYRCLTAPLTRHSITIPEKVVRRLMKQESLAVPKTKRWRYSS